jgi:predicted RNA-binding Zn-ribbon protein involved in translation (DUF1610 family)
MKGSKFVYCPKCGRRFLVDWTLNRANFTTITCPHDGCGYPTLIAALPLDDLKGPGQ